MNCQGCKEEERIAFEFLEMGYDVGFFFKECHKGFFAVNKKGVIVAGL